MKFTKMHGCGNDYIYVNGFEEKIEDEAKASILVSDRHFGIGADGLIIIKPSDTADFEMVMYNADGSLKYKWGITMDFAIRNLRNGKVLFGEIKRQDGWIETTKPAAGRGNAHERSAKYFTPGLMRILREKSRLSEKILPFWLVIAGDITRDPRRNREIAYWFQGYESNFFMWRDTEDVGALLDFFENNLLPYLL